MQVGKLQPGLYWNRPTTCPRAVISELSSCDRDPLGCRAIVPLAPCQYIDVSRIGVL